MSKRIDLHHIDQFLDLIMVRSYSVVSLNLSVILLKYMKHYSMCTMHVRLTCIIRAFPFVMVLVHYYPFRDNTLCCLM